MKKLQLLKVYLSINPYRFGVLPYSLQISKVIPVYNAKAKENFFNYRPISLLPSVSKIQTIILLFTK